MPKRSQKRKNFARALMIGLAECKRGIEESRRNYDRLAAQVLAPPTDAPHSVARVSATSSPDHRPIEQRVGSNTPHPGQELLSTLVDQCIERGEFTRSEWDSVTNAPAKEKIRALQDSIRGEEDELAKGRLIERIVCLTREHANALAPPSLPTTDNSVRIDATAKIWERVVNALSPLRVGQNIETLRKEPHLSIIKNHIRELLAASTDVRVVVSRATSFCQSLLRELSLASHNVVSLPSVVEASQESVLNANQTQWMDCVLAYLGSSGDIDRQLLERYMVDARFQVVERFILSIPVTFSEDALRLACERVLTKIKSVFEDNDSLRGTRASVTPSDFGRTILDLGAQVPPNVKQPTEDTTRTLTASPSAAFEIRPTLFRGFDQRKWDKILSETGFSVMQAAMRNVLIAPVGVVNGVQTVRLKAIEGLFQVEVNVLYPVCTHFIHDRSRNIRVFKDLLSSDGLLTDLEDDAAEVAMTLVVIATMGSVRNFPRCEKDRMHRVEEYAADMASRILGKAVATGSELVSEVMGSTRTLSPTHRAARRKTKSKAPSDGPRFTSKPSTRAAPQNSTKKMERVKSCHRCGKTGHLIADCWVKAK